MKKIFYSILSLVLLLPGGALAKDYGLGEAASAAGIDSIFSSSNPLEVVGNIIGVGLSLLGIIFFGIILFAGFRWMTAMGNPDKAEKAKDMLEAAAIGLVIVLAAYAIAKFVFSALGIS